MTEPVVALSGIPEYDENPLINRLPPIMGISEIYASLERMPLCQPHERELLPHIRAHLMKLRLDTAFIPTTQQAVMAAQIHQLIRGGYNGVSLADASYAARLRDHADQLEAGRKSSELRTPFRSTAHCGTLIGPSGMGKTTIVGRVLEQVPQVVEHLEPVTVQQVVHVRLECPSSGSPKQLCLSFFKELDDLLGTEYYKKFGGLTTEHMVLRMAQVAQVHRLGLLVVDEIQYLRRTRVCEDEVLNLLTTLVNVINVPVLMVGTMAAVPLVTSTFRNARRVQGHASAVFEPMKQGPEWDRFLAMLFRLQWTSEVTPLTPQLSQVIWEESQGIVDIVMKIFMLAQLRLMRRSETRAASEIIKPSLIRQIMKEDLRLVRPMLRALARGSKGLVKYDDLRPLELHFQDMLSNFLGAGVELPTMEAVAPTAAAGPAEGDALSAKLSRSLIALGFAPDAAELMIAQARKAVPAGDPMQTFAALMDAAKPKDVECRTPPIKRRGRAKAVPANDPLEPSDIRGGDGGKQADAEAVYAQMLSAGTAGGIVAQAAA